MFSLLFKLRYVASVVLFVVSYYGYNFVRVETSEHERVLNTLTAELASYVTNEILPAEEVCNITVARLIGDDEAAVTGLLQHWLFRHGHRVTEASHLEQIEQYFVEDKVIRTLEEVETLAQTEGSRYVLFGEVKRLCTVPDRQRLETSLKLYDKDHQAVVVDTIYSVTEASLKPAPMITGSLKEIIFNKHFIMAALWVTLLFTLPIAIARPIARILHKQSNRHNAFMLLSYLVIAVGTAQFSWANDLSGWVTWTLLLVGTPVAATYFAYICQSLEKYRF